MRAAHRFAPVWFVSCLLVSACEGRLSDADAGSIDAGEHADGGRSPADDAAPAPPADDAGVVDGGPAVDPYQVCSEDGWCFEQPYPVAEDLYAVTRVGPEQLLLVGARGRILSFDGLGVRGLESGTDRELYAVRAFSANDAWVVGAESTFLHFDGERFTPYAFDVTDGEVTPADDLRALWGVSGTDIWAVGHQGALWHYDGERWVKQTSVTNKHLYGIWGASASQIYAVGADGVLLSYDGNQWIESSLPGGGTAFDIHGSAADDIWVAGADGRMWHHDGAAFTALSEPFSSAHLSGLFVRARDEVYVAASAAETAYRFDGSTWLPLSVGSREPLEAVHVDDSGVFAVGMHGTFVRFAGGARTLFSRGERVNYLDISAGSASSPWVVGDQTLRLGADGPTVIASATERALYGCFALSDQLAWAVGTQGTIVRWDGEESVVLESGSERWLRAVWAASAESVWVVGEGGTLLGLFNGTSFLPSASPTRVDLFDVWGMARDDVWAAGDDGTLLHFGGRAWESFASPTTARLQALSGTARDDVWAVGASGTVLHFDGGVWSTVREGESYTLYGVWANGPELYAVGSSGTVLSFDGETWTLERTPTDRTLFAIGRGRDGVLRAVGADGVVLVRR